MDNLLIAYFWVAGLFTNIIYLCGVAAQFLSHFYIKPSGRPSGKLSIIRPISKREAKDVEQFSSLTRQLDDNTEVLLIMPDSEIAEKITPLLTPGVKAIGVSSEGMLSPKVAKMEAAWKFVQNSDFVAITDADISVPDGLADRMLAYFQDEQVAGVSSPCLTTMSGLTGSLLMHNLCCDYLPICSVATHFKQLTFLQGAFMMVRRSVIDELGGISKLADTFGDDLRLGRLIEKAGYKLEVMPELLIHPCANNNAKQLLQRYHRWMIAQKAELPGKYYIEILLNPTVIPLLLYLTSKAIDLKMLAIIIGCRVTTAFISDFVFIRRVTHYRLWQSILRPVSDLVHFIIQVTALFSTRAVWQGRRYKVAINGKIIRRID